ncbi:hypothetical protein APHAL10511_001762 [Amanita phalloides]|nr:hypothetical protein APHAL10511_001762 [Amanita phalloides]
MLARLCHDQLFARSVRSFSTVRGAPPGAWKFFPTDGVIHPHDFLYKSRRIIPSPPRRAPEVGPPPAQARYHDVFHQLSVDPLSTALHPLVLSRYVSEMGKINRRSSTGLTMKSQRKVGKALRRAKMMGLLPMLSKHRAAPVLKKLRKL